MPSATPGPGRPKSTKKRQAILDAARDLFLKHGYSATSLEMVAERSGVSKPTVYNHFGSKQALAAAVILVRKQALDGALGDLEHDSDRPQEDLREFALQFTELVLQPQARLWDRLAIAEAGRHPQLARTLFQAGPQHVHQIVTRYIERQTAAGRLAAEAPELAAEHFLGLLLGLELVRGQMANQPKRSKRERRQRADAAVQAFLAAYGNSNSNGEAGHR